MVKSRSAMQESEKMKGRSLGQEDPLEEGMATHPNILAPEVQKRSAGDVPHASVAGDSSSGKVSGNSTDCQLSVKKHT